MAKTKQQKEQALSQALEKTNQSKSTVIGSFDQVTVNDIELLRAELRQNEAEMVVLKKTLLKKLLADKNITGIDVDAISGNIGVIFGYQDEVAPAKIADKFRKEHEEQFVFQGGFLEGKFLSIEEVMALAKLPSKEELIAKVIGSLNAPVSNFVGSLSGILRNVVGVLSAIKDTK